MLVWYVLRGDWFVWSKGMSPAVTPRIREGWISTTSTVRLVRSAGHRATSKFAISAASTYRTMASSTTDVALTGAAAANHASSRSPATSTGRTTRPSSVCMYRWPPQGDAHTDGLKYGAGPGSGGDAVARPRTMVAIRSPVAA